MVGSEDSLAVGDQMLKLGHGGSDTCLDMLHAELAAYEGQLGEALTRRIASDIT